MISPKDFVDKLIASGISFFTGVPDSLLKGIIAEIEKKYKQSHYITANEGAAVALAAGYHFSTGEVPLVYLQNSGLGNMVNPLTSLTAKEVYSIPMLLLIGWRGEPGIPDEPQHEVMGKITPALLNLLRIPFIVIKKGDANAWREAIDDSLEVCGRDQKPVAILVEDACFETEDLALPLVYEMDSEKAVSILYSTFKKDDIVICTTGKIGRVFYKINSHHKKLEKYFLNVGSMGYALSIGTGVAMHKKQRVFILDGDGASLMHTGALALAASLQLSNLVYIVLNNGVHQSVGNQPTFGFFVDFCLIAKGFGFSNPARIEHMATLKEWSFDKDKNDFVEIRINSYTQEPLPRPDETPEDAKKRFMINLGKA